MHNMFNENAEQGEIHCQFPSLLGSRNDLALYGEHYLWSATRPGVPAGSFGLH